MSSKAIIYEAPYSTPAGGTVFGTANAQNAKPNGTNVILEVHDYEGNNPSSMLTHVQEWAAVTGISGYFMGEFGTTTTNQTSAESYYASMYTALKQYGFASCVWDWAASDNYALLDSSSNPNFRVTAINQAYASVYGSIKPSGWAGLHGVDYLWPPILPWNPTALSPALSFPLMKSYGWNLIRTGIGWDKYLSNPTEFIQ